QECEEVLKVINIKHPSYKYLADVPEDIIYEYETFLRGNLYRRALFVIQENQRVLNGINAIKGKSFSEVGKYLYESHSGLKELYEVSCPELDFMVDFSNSHTAVLGSRMMGGGFGG